ncbi:MAG: metallophosphoesterase, partial [Nitrolancea sp.]
MTTKHGPPDDPITALRPRGTGHQFVCYADSCSGVPGALHERTFAEVNRVVARLHPQPEFICFPGDEIQGLLADDDALREQWRYWIEREMSWLDHESIPLYHTTGNHTTYDDASEAIFREMLAHLPRNGPPGQAGLSYFVRRGDLLLVFVNTLWSGIGGEGRVETEWLDRTLAANADARHKLVCGHHPAFPVNGFSGAYQRELAPDNAAAFWQVLLRHDVIAYLCSHILAFDVQVHQGILQITTAGAGTAHRMPEEFEYLHCVQLALDEAGLRYQVLDNHGQLREWLMWPLEIS